MYVLIFVYLNGIETGIGLVVKEMQQPYLLVVHTSYSLVHISLSSHVCCPFVMMPVGLASLLQGCVTSTLNVTSWLQLCYYPGMMLQACTLYKLVTTHTHCNMLVMSEAQLVTPPCNISCLLLVWGHGRGRGPVAIAGKMMWHLGMDS